MPIYSMTGFARSQVRVPLPNEGQLSYTLTVKSVNHRFLDVQLRLPSGLDALEMVRERDPDIPFIIVSGQISEETAVAAMKASQSSRQRIATRIATAAIPKRMAKSRPPWLGTIA